VLFLYILELGPTGLCCILPLTSSRNVHGGAPGGGPFSAPIPESLWHLKKGPYKGQEPEELEALPILRSMAYPVRPMDTGYCVLHRRRVSPLASRGLCNSDRPLLLFRTVMPRARPAVSAVRNRK
jgi:hypothetical protein